MREYDIMEIKVFDINETVKTEQLETVDIENIKKVFDKIFSTTNMEHLKIECCANKNSIFEWYLNNKKNFDKIEFANNLLKAEQKNDGTRNGQITEGNLFIQEKDNKLVILKLENIETVDKNNHYVMQKSFSTEMNYYKGCIFEGDLKRIIVIDKSPKVAKYWREKFLNLSVIKDNFDNSKELISLIKSDELFTKEINDLENFEKIKDRVENFIFENSDFDKVALSNILRQEKLIDQTDLNKIYSEKSKEIDTEFSLDRRALKEGYKRTIIISDSTKIYTDNYTKLRKRQEIEYKGGKIILTVDDKYMDQLPEELRPNKSKNGN